MSKLSVASIFVILGPEHSGSRRNLAKLFPGIRVIRMDVDTTTEKGSHEKWLTMFREKQADVLLGTQMVAKGLGFSRCDPSWGHCCGYRAEYS